MHPVQAAPRQSVSERWLRTGQGEMHPVQAAPRQRFCYGAFRAHAQRCTPCRQRRGKDLRLALIDVHGSDAPRAGSAEAKAAAKKTVASCIAMHPVQAAPRQS